jgi:hypothetical protein
MATLDLPELCCLILRSSSADTLRNPDGTSSFVVPETDAEEGESR